MRNFCRVFYRKYIRLGNLSAIINFIRLKDWLFYLFWLAATLAMIIIKVITPADAIKTSFLVIFIFGAELITLANKSIAAEIIKANKGA